MNSAGRRWMPGAEKIAMPHIDGLRTKRGDRATRHNREKHMKNLLRSYVGFGLLLGTMLIGTHAAAQTASFAATYSGNGSSSTSCSSTYNIMGKEPTTGTHPVFIWTVGTGETYTDDLSNTMVNAMASRGFVSASVQYNSGTFGSGTTLTNRARCIYNGSSAASAISKLCARSSADCSKGIVVAGLSQGSIMADLAKNFDSRVRAAYGQGDGVKYSIYDLTSAVANGNRTLPSDHLRVVNGNRDTFLAGSDKTRTSDQKLTGFNCGTSALSCLQSNGSGWYIVSDSQVQDGQADHCYMLIGGCTSPTGIDPGFLNGT